MARDPFYFCGFERCVGGAEKSERGANDLGDLPALAPLFASSLYWMCARISAAYFACSHLPNLVLIVPRP